MLLQIEYFNVTLPNRLALKHFMDGHSLGPNRAAAITNEQKSEIAKKAALARWGNRPLQAIRGGNFKEHFGIDVDVYVLDDHKRSAVLSERGISRALGFSPTGGNRLKEFLASKAIEIPGREVAAKLSQPIVFQWNKGGRGELIVHGYPATLLIDVCRLISASAQSGVIGKRHQRIINQSRTILDASANLGIDHLVYAVAGYDPTAEEVIQAFKTYVQEEAKKYEKEFPNELYAQWHRLYQIPVPERGKPWKFGQLTIRHVYYPVAQSQGKIYELLKALKSRGGDPRKKLFQFLNELGARALRIQLGRVLEMAESSPDEIAYEKKIRERFGGQSVLAFLPPIPSPSKRKDHPDQLQLLPTEQE